MPGLCKFYFVKSQEIKEVKRDWRKATIAKANNVLKNIFGITKPP